MNLGSQIQNIRRIVFTNLSIPSVIFADANWYGSLRGGVTFGGGEDARFMDGGSRWGIKGSNELAEGLSANYRFEHKFSTENAGLDGGGRLASVGLSGGFGTVSLGQIWSASFNATGAITDNSLLWGDSATSYRVGNALSYSNSIGGASVQIDAIMDSDKDTGDAVDQVEFGMSIGLGDIGKLAVAYVEKKDVNIADAWVHVPATPGKAAVKGKPAEYYLVQGDDDTAEDKGKDDDPDIQLHMIKILVPTGDLDSDTAGRQNTFLNADGSFAENGAQNIVNRISYSAAGKRVFDVGDISDSDTVVEEPECGTNNVNCHEVEVYVATSRTVATGNTPIGGAFSRTNNVVTITTAAAPGGNVTETYYIVVDENNGSHATGLLEEGSDSNDFRMVDGVDEVLATPYEPAGVEKDGVADISPGSKGTHIAAEFGLGGITAFVGYSKTETNGGALKGRSEDGIVKRGDDKMLARTSASETKVGHAGVRGSMGDGGMNYYLAYRSVDTDGKKTSPYLINLNKSLGDGATAFIEHANNDDGKSGKTWVGLKVDF